MKFHTTMLLHQSEGFRSIDLGSPHDPVTGQGSSDTQLQPAHYDMYEYIYRRCRVLGVKVFLRFQIAPTTAEAAEEYTTANFTPYATAQYKVARSNQLAYIEVSDDISENLKYYDYHKLKMGLYPTKAVAFRQMTDKRQSVTISRYFKMRDFRSAELANKGQDVDANNPYSMYLKMTTLTPYDHLNLQSTHQAEGQNAFNPYSVRVFATLYYVVLFWDPNVHHLSRIDSTMVKDPNIGVDDPNL